MNIVISNSGEIPIYEQIASQIKSAVIAGEVKPGEPLPSLRFLAKELRVSVISTKRAYEELEREGYITSVPGKGSFAAEINRELLREEQYKRLEEHLNEAVDAARTAGDLPGGDEGAAGNSVRRIASQLKGRRRP